MSFPNFVFARRTRPRCWARGGTPVCGRCQPGK